MAKGSTSPNKEVATIIKALKAQGWEVVPRKGKSLAFPADGGRPIPIHHTPSDSRWKSNLVAQLRRAGAVL